MLMMDVAEVWAVKRLVVSQRYTRDPSVVRSA
jgi:hypothetical protein